MQKAYNRINWENYPSEATALNETNLNRMDYGLNEVDNRIIGLDTTKLDVNSANGLVQAVTINNETGTITVTKMDGTTVSLETNLSKISTNWTYNRETQQIVLTQSDGSQVNIDLSYLIQQNEFTDTTTIAFSVVSEYQSPFNHGRAFADGLSRRYTNCNVKRTSRRKFRRFQQDFIRILGDWWNSDKNRRGHKQLQVFCRAVTGIQKRLRGLPRSVARFTRYRYCTTHRPYNAGQFHRRMFVL